VLVLSAFTFIPKKKAAVIDDGYVTKMISLPAAKEKVKQAEKPKAAQQPKEKTTSQTWTKIVLVDNKEPIKPLATLSDTVAIASVTEIGKPGNLPVIATPGEGVGGNGKDPETVKPIDINTPMLEPEIMPSYPGGINALRKFLERNLINPRDMEEGETVSVKIRFVVGYDGKLKSFVTAQDGGEAFNIEVIRVLKKMPDWVPGKSNGQNVSVYFTIPVKFVPAN
jgi:protein TonB